VKAIAVVGGIRFPSPNNVTHPMPVFAVHGTKDPVNPYLGHGNPEYWEMSVPAAVDMWVQLNRCRRMEAYPMSNGVMMERHTHCSAGVDVMLVTVQGGGHTWPGSAFDFDQHLGYKSDAIDASDMITDFLLSHVPVVDEVGGGHGRGHAKLRPSLAHHARSSNRGNVIAKQLTTPRPPELRSSDRAAAYVTQAVQNARRWVIDVSQAAWKLFALSKKELTADSLSSLAQQVADRPLALIAAGALALLALVTMSTLCIRGQTSGCRRCGAAHSGDFEALTDDPLEMERTLS